jgi:hypothetical protein
VLNTGFRVNGTIAALNNVRGALPLAPWKWGASQLLSVSLRESTGNLRALRVIQAPGKLLILLELEADGLGEPTP